jgi:diaminohydroxyphosphoribosylaminopyrimidine deaminase/5-amino-6-(5-phosphoribosylamino)uracil reductase
LLLYVAPSVIGDPGRGLFDRAMPLRDLAGRTTLEWESVERVGEDLRIVARMAAQGAAPTAREADGRESQGRAHVGRGDAR